MVTWVKANMLFSSAVVAWLVALAPVGKFGKGIAHIVAIATSIESVRYSRQLVTQQAKIRAMEIMNEELESTHLALQEYSQERELQEIYGMNSTYSPEVREELNKSLEFLYRETAANQESGTSTSTFKKNLYLAVVSLLEAGTPETYVIEKILCLGGRNWEKGKQMLQELLEEGSKNGWQ